MGSSSSSSIYLASPEGDTGKSTVALGVLHLLAASGGRVGVFRPISRTNSGQRDYILELLIEHDSTDLSYEDCIGVTYDQVHADPDAALSEIVTRFHAVEQRCDAVLVIGSDYTDIASPSELSFNARIAANLQTPMLLALKAAERSEAEVVGLAELCLAELATNHAQAVALIANRCDPERLVQVREALESATGLPAWALPEDPVLIAPTVAELMAELGGEIYSGDPELLSREAMHVMVGGMTVEHILERLTEGLAVITPADRSDVLVSLVAANAAEGFPKLSGIILNGGLMPHPKIAALMEGLQSPLPIITCEQGTYETARAAAHARARMNIDSVRKIDVALNLMEEHVDSVGLLEKLQLPIPEVVTPQMFEYQLIEQARKNKKRIVLPEGGDDRILRAAGRLLRRQVADLTILGEERAVRDRAAELGIDLSDAVVIDPATSELLDEFIETYTELRKHKGMDAQRARTIVQDVSYFGTLMVQLGYADGMVSGAVHTTAHTIRPAFEIIKTVPGVSTVSSVFFMCLADHVLAYGDCAVVPDPTAEQLADIAISSAATSARFGIEPRVALLSYSTGESGSGADVEKVREAAKLVRERAPELLMEGPIQYDAAVDPSVASTKMPNSPVAGQATVLIFPDLNTGNNTYKAVQRSADAVAVGPVLQGLRKPINDLSRGALVSDIVNTVAITAIQAQGQPDGQ
ncbi:phosphotransacetylase [Williamsia limnetica]|uniref:Phosphate acetyltransferase n=1 Tax=Williamsia limnetica TaxID=882452 RepID=A0A318RV48_WILLI|nr:phosphate acetyltransferase [Williamsia limnetica]PYE16831.1 phosphotransacetylase [Williamsia limnetica]